MRGQEKRIIQEPDRSFIYRLETTSFPKFHYHPEYELTYIIKGRGRCLVGDYIDHFRETWLVLHGPFLPHEYNCDSTYNGSDGEFLGKAIVIEFVHDFLGTGFFKLPENYRLAEVLKMSSQGMLIFGKAKRAIVDQMYDMINASKQDSLYILLGIFRILSTTNQYKLLASPGYIDPNFENSNSPISKARDYILQNFSKKIQSSDLLNITNMSNTTFSTEFKRVNRMSFKKYLSRVRIGFACKMLIIGEMNVAEVAYISGFDNISNFNKQFKRVKGITPKQYQIECGASDSTA